jgi:hypothetical protein
LLPSRGSDFNNYAVTFLEWNLNTISGPAFDSLFTASREFIASLDIDESDFYDDFIKAALSPDSINAGRVSFLVKRSGIT